MSIYTVGVDKDQLTAATKNFSSRNLGSPVFSTDKWVSTEPRVNDETSTFGDGVNRALNSTNHRGEGILVEGFRSELPLLITGVCQRHRDELLHVLLEKASVDGAVVGICKTMSDEMRCTPQGEC